MSVFFFQMHEIMCPDYKKAGGKGYLEEQGKPRTWGRIKRAERANVS